MNGEVSKRFSLEVIVNTTCTIGLTPLVVSNKDP